MPYKDKLKQRKHVREAHRRRRMRNRVLAAMRVLRDLAEVYRLQGATPAGQRGRPRSPWKWEV
jgi:hypothetical protein